MLLGELKKLKVAELRAKLRERGLDYKGVKAELVARLISGADVRDVNSAETTSLDEDNDDKQTCLSSTVLTEVPVQTENRCEELLEEYRPQPEYTKHRLRTYVDQSTQTETDSCPQCCCSSARKEPQTLGSDQRLQEQVRDQIKSSFSPAQVPALPQDILFESSPPVSTVLHPDHRPHTPEADQLAYRASEETSELETEGQDQCINIRKPHEEKGRDYYEFKEEIQYNRAKTPEPGPESEDDMEVDDDDVVRLDLYNSDLHFEVGTDGCSGQPLLWEKFPLLWSGCRVTHGFTQGKVGFEVKFAKKLSAAAVDTIVDPEPHLLRVGWSVDRSSLQLGEDELSFGLDAAGRAVTGGKADEYGESFSEGDVIGCYAFISKGGEAELSFHKNGRPLGVAFRVSSSVLKGQALYPHVLCKNCSVTLNLDFQGTEWYPGPLGYCPLPALPSGQRTRASLPPLHRKDCEVLMMVGMPGSGKSHWAEKHVVKNPEKCYNVLRTKTILQCMRLPGPEHKELLLQQATQCLTHLIKIAATKRRNFILDQANIYPSARKHKMLRFRGYWRKAVVVVPSDVEWKRRLQQQRDDESVEVPEMSLLKSKVSFTLPEQGELLEEVQFVELCFEEVQILLATYKEEARSLLPVPPKRKKLQNRPFNPRGRAYGWSQNSCGRYVYPEQSQPGRQKLYGWHPSTFAQSYGCNSDPQQYRDYYQPCTGQWNMYDQSQSNYSIQDYYFGNQCFW